ncbi:MAG: hypothetical protein COZ06_36215, partial [Armatimonadetes bacterium CG_4_10_14_3_um_filter_66_18]
MISETPTARMAELQAGEAVFDQDAPGDEMYWLVEGRVSLVRRFGAETRKLASVGPGGFFGEMGLVRETIGAPPRRLPTQPSSSSASIEKNSTLILQPYLARGRSPTAPKRLTGRSQRAANPR